MANKIEVQSFDKTAVVTGSTKGIGKAIGIALLKDGYKVIFNYANSDANAELLNTELHDTYPGMYEIIKADLSNISGVNSFSNEILKHFSSISVLVLNNGTTSRSSLNDISEDEWNKVLNTNITAPLFLIQHLSKHIREAGRIIFIGSLMGVYPHSMSIGYGVTKAGAHMLAKYLVKEFAERMITVNTIVPGFVDTPWQKNKPAEIRKAIEEKIALGRFAKSEEIAEVCMDILRCEYINGAEIIVDGGYCYK